MPVKDKISLGPIDKYILYSINLSLLILFR
jgi:hypothetical protein